MLFCKHIKNLLSSNGFSDHQPMGWTQAPRAIILRIQASLIFDSVTSTLHLSFQEKEKKTYSLLTIYLQNKMFYFVCISKQGCNAPHLNTVTSSESHCLLHHTHQLFTSRVNSHTLGSWRLDKRCLLFFQHSAVQIHESVLTVASDSCS